MSAYPISSMTGYARRSQDTPWGELQLELRSVNHRYLDISLRVPDELRAFESLLRDRIKARVGRGKVEAGLRLRAPAGGAATLDLDADLLKQMAAATSQIEKAFVGTFRMSPLDVLRWPGVVRETERDESALGEAVSGLIEATLDEFCTARAEEGARTAEVLNSRLDGIGTLIEAVQKRLPEQARLWRDKLDQRMQELLEVDAERREQALVQFVTRLDVDEEIERLKSHVAAVRKTLASSEPVGRKLDFYMQEFNREANTLGSKSMDAELTRCAVELKVLIEQMREQVQNIE